MLGGGLGHDERKEFERGKPGKSQGEEAANRASGRIKKRDFIIVEAGLDQKGSKRTPPTDDL